MIENFFRIAVYDMTISDIKKRKEKRIEYDSTKKASAKLKLSENIIKRVAKNKEKIYVEELKKIVAIRHI